MSALDRITHPLQRQQAGRARAWLKPGNFSPLLYLAPFLLFFIVFQIYPIFQGLYVSLTKWDLSSPARFIGLANYAALMQGVAQHEPVRRAKRAAGGGDSARPGDVGQRPHPRPRDLP